MLPYLCLVQIENTLQFRKIFLTKLNLIYYEKSFLNIAAAAAIVAISLVSCKKTEATATEGTTDSTKVDSTKVDSTVTTTVDSTKAAAQRQILLKLTLLKSRRN